MSNIWHTVFSWSQLTSPNVWFIRESANSLIKGIVFLQWPHLIKYLIKSYQGA